MKFSVVTSFRQKAQFGRPNNEKLAYVMFSSMVQNWSKMFHHQSDLNACQVPLLTPGKSEQRVFDNKASLGIILESCGRAVVLLAPLSSSRPLNLKRWSMPDLRTPEEIRKYTAFVLPCGGKILLLLHTHTLIIPIFDMQLSILLHHGPIKSHGFN